jgi:hypothetical protein
MVTVVIVSRSISTATDQVASSLSANGYVVTRPLFVATCTA